MIRFVEWSFVLAAHLCRSDVKQQISGRGALPICVTPKFESGLCQDLLPTGWGLGTCLCFCAVLISLGRLFATGTSQQALANSLVASSTTAEECKSPRRGRSLRR